MKAQVLIEQREVDLMVKGKMLTEVQHGVYLWTDLGKEVMRLFIEFQTGIFNPTALNILPQDMKPPEEPKDTP